MSNPSSMNSRQLQIEISSHINNDLTTRMVQPTKQPGWKLRTWMFVGAGSCTKGSQLASSTTEWNVSLFSNKHTKEAAGNKKLFAMPTAIINYFYHAFIIVIQDGQTMLLATADFVKSFLSIFHVYYVRTYVRTSMKTDRASHTNLCHRQTQVRITAERRTHLAKLASRATTSTTTTYIRPRVHCCCCCCCQASWLQGEKDGRTDGGKTKCSKIRKFRDNLTRKARKRTGPSNSREEKGCLQVS